MKDFLRNNSLGILMAALGIGGFVLVIVLFVQRVSEDREALRNGDAETGRVPGSSITRVIDKENGVACYYRFDSTLSCILLPGGPQRYVK